MTKYNTKWFKEIMYAKYGNEFTVLDKYVNAHTHIEMKHNHCGHVFTATPANLSRNAGCMNCKGKRISKAKTKTHKEFYKEFVELVGSEYQLLDRYKHGRSKVRVEHTVCGNVYEVRPQDFLSGRRCPKCKYTQFGDERRKTDESFKKEVYDLVGKEYTFLEEYRTSFDKIKVQHNKCGTVYKVTPTLFLEDRRCPHCAMYARESLGEKKVAEHLDNLGVNYEREYTFDDLRIDKKLRFDFAVFDKSKLKVLIEFDGRQHFEPVEVFGGLESFKKTVYSDKLKNNYCKDNNIPLVRLVKNDLTNLEETLNI